MASRSTTVLDASLDLAPARAADCAAVAIPSPAIHVHATWAGWAALHSDPRFARDYAVLHETWTRPPAAGEAMGEPRAGDCVRRAAASPETIARLSVELRRLGLDRPRGRRVAIVDPDDDRCGVRGDDGSATHRRRASKLARLAGVGSEQEDRGQAEGGQQVHSTAMVQLAALRRQLR